MKPFVTEIDKNLQIGLSFIFLQRKNVPTAICRLFRHIAKPHSGEMATGTVYYSGKLSPDGMGLAWLGCITDSTNYKSTASGAKN